MVRAGGVLELLLVTAGIALRLRQYFADRPLWLDEAMLANTIVGREVYDLVSAPLPDNQAAPPGTLALMRLCVLTLGPTEGALRLVPLVAGIVAVLAAWRLAARVFPSRAARACLIGLVALSPTLVYYSVEAKQYGVDAAAALVLLAVAAGDGLWSLTLAGAIAPWLSHTALFLVPGVGLVRAAVAWRRGGVRALVPLVLVAVGWGASVALMLALIRDTLGGNAVLQDFWQTGFAPFPIRSAADVAWYGNVCAALVAMALKLAGADGPAPYLWWPPWLDAVVAALLVAGVGGLARRAAPRRALVVIVVAVAAALAASVAHQYPLAHRLLVFAVPFVLVLLAGAVDGLAALGAPGALGAGVLGVGLVALMLPPAAALARQSFARADVRGALAYVAARAQPGDRLAPTAWSEPAVRFYRGRYDLRQLGQAPSIAPGTDAQTYVSGLRARHMLTRTWVVFTHRFNEREQFLRPARALAPQLDAWEGDGAGAYLFDFGQAPAE